jgi:transcriptional regulator with XRE-family HTH domain
MPRYRTPRPIDPELGPRLRAAREGASLAQEEASRSLRVDVGTLGNWEASRTEPKVSQLLRMARLYQCEPSDLLGVIAP